MERHSRVRSVRGGTKSHRAQFRRDVEVHIRDVAEKYLINGETQDTAFLFVPSEASIFAEIHENFEGLVQKAHRARIVIVSPSLLMLSLQVIQAVLKDVRMREQAHLIQGEVIRLMEHAVRLDDRAPASAGRISARRTRTLMTFSSRQTRLTKRGQKIEALEFAEPVGEVVKDIDAGRSCCVGDGTIALAGCRRRRLAAVMERTCGSRMVGMALARIAMSCA